MHGEGAVNPNDVTLYAGLAHARFAVDSFHFGHGIALSRTFAHLSAPFLAGFLPPPKAEQRRRPEPRSVDVLAQLHVPEGSFPLWGIDRVNTVWWLAVLLRLRATPRVTVVGLSSEPFAGEPRIWRGAGFWPAEAEPRRVVLDPEARKEILEEDLRWVAGHWVSSGALLRDEGGFGQSMRLLDQSYFAPAPAVALQCLWDALGILFFPKPPADDRLAAALAAYLQVPAAEQREFADRTGTLLGFRAAAAEGEQDGLEEPVVETYALARRVLLQVVENGFVPTRKELETGLLGPH